MISNLIGSMRLVKDSDGGKSWTHTLAVPACILITFWFILGGIDLTVKTVHIAFTAKSGTDYMLAITPWLAFLTQRDWNPTKANGATPAAVK